jgi:hypothetical protein
LQCSLSSLFSYIKNSSCSFYCESGNYLLVLRDFLLEDIGVDCRLLKFQLFPKNAGGADGGLCLFRSSLSAFVNKTSDLSFSYSVILLLVVILTFVYSFILLI